MSGKNIHSVNEWTSRQDLEEGYTIANAKYLRDYTFVCFELRRYALALYVIGVKMKNHYLTKMMYSAKRQAEFCAAVCSALRQKKVTKEYYDLFERDIKMLYRRLDHISMIVKENIHLSEYEPFFNTIGDIIDYDGEYEELAELGEKWNAEHQEEVKKHMEEIKPELDRHNAFIQQKREKRVSEQKALRQEKKAENQYVKDIKNNAKKNKSEYKKLERSFEKYYTGKA